jgi:hypothetical protein
VLLLPAAPAAVLGVPNAKGGVLLLAAASPPEFAFALSVLTPNEKVAELLLFPGQAIAVLLPSAAGVLLLLEMPKSELFTGPVSAAVWVGNVSVCCPKLPGVVLPNRFPGDWPPAALPVVLPNRFPGDWPPAALPVAWGAAAVDVMALPTAAQLAEALAA